MPILLSEPITIAPATKTYDGVWICSFIANFPSNDSGYLRIETKPFSTTTGEIFQVDPEVISTDQIWLMMQEVPEAAIAMNSVISAIIPIKNWIEDRKQKEIEERNKSESPIIEEPIVVEPIIVESLSKSSVPVEIPTPNIFSRFWKWFTSLE